MPRKTPGTFAPPEGGAASFNEAAARCRGKRLRGRDPRPDRGHASMRPRPDAAENRKRTMAETKRTVLQ